MSSGSTGGQDWSQPTTVVSRGTAVASRLPAVDGPSGSPVLPGSSTLPASLDSSGNTVLPGNAALPASTGPADGSPDGVSPTDGTAQAGHGTGSAQGTAQAGHHTSHELASSWRQRAFGDDPSGWRGYPALLAVAAMAVVVAIGCVIDLARGVSAKGGLNIAIIIAALLAVVIVRRSGLFPVIIAPPLLYALASLVVLIIRSGGLGNRQVIYDAAANWLVYGFPSLAAATAAVLVIAGVRLIVHK